MKGIKSSKDEWRTNGVVLENTEDKVDAIKRLLDADVSDIDSLDIDPTAGAFDMDELINDSFDLDIFDIDTNPVVDDSAGFDL